MNLTVWMDDQVKNLLEAKGKMLTISKLNLNGCCVPTEEVLTEFTSPENKQQYFIVKEGDNSIYIEKNLRFKNNEVKLSLAGFLLKTIRVSGLQRF